MTTPWLNIPLTDYESHMALPNIGQAQLLSDVLASALKNHTPQSIAVLGCAGGNGFDCISPQVTRRVVGIDINPEYIQQTQARFARRFATLELFAGDLQTERFDFAPVDLLFIGLLFEHVDAGAVFEKIPDMLNPRGVLVTVVQLPSDTIPDISPSPFVSLNILAPVMRFISACELERLAAAHGFRLADKQLLKSAGGKFFHTQEFIKLK